MNKTETELVIITSAGDIKIIRPAPITEAIEVVLYKSRMGPQYAVDALFEGYSVLIVDFYSSGLSVLNLLKQQVNSKFSDQSYQGQREARAVFRELSGRLLLKIIHHKLLVRKAPEIGWLKVLYQGLGEFLLPFPLVQGLNSAWQWYEKGIYIPVLGKKINPWYGMYFPTRFEHLELFENWLKNYRGEKESAIDVGIGSGVLSLLMLKNGFNKITGTDINPNAIVGLDEYLVINNLQQQVKLIYGDMLTGCSSESELIVFNPPWLPASYNTEGIDSAIYYSTELFPRFFSEAATHLKKGGRVVILFSNLAQITNNDVEHPIKKELESGERFIKEFMVHKQARPASKLPKRNTDHRTGELVELWVLKPINV